MDKVLPKKEAEYSQGRNVEISIMVVRSPYQRIVTVHNTYTQRCQ